MNKKIFQEIKKRFLSLTLTEVFILITIATFTIFIVKFFGIKKEWKTIRIEVIGKNWSENYNPYGYRTPFWMSNKIKVGQIEKSKSGKTIGKITNIENYERGGEEAEMFITLEVESVLNKKTNTYSYKDKNINIGSAIELNIENVSIIGQIVDNNVPKDFYPSKEFIVTMIAKNIYPWKVDEIKPGIKMTNRSNNETIAQIISTNVDKSSYKVFGFDSNQHLIVNTDDTKDLTVTAKIKCYLQDEKWYFAGHQNIKIGSILYLYTKNINMNFEIKAIDESTN